MTRRSEILNLRLRAPGSPWPAHLTNNWGPQLNAELERIDAAIGAVCTPQQIADIRQRIGITEIL